MIWKGASWNFFNNHVDGFVQDCSNSSYCSLALSHRCDKFELLLVISQPHISSDNCHDIMICISVLIVYHNHSTVVVSTLQGIHKLATLRVKICCWEPLMHGLWLKFTFRAATVDRGCWRTSEFLIDAESWVVDQYRSERPRALGFKWSDLTPHLLNAVRETNTGPLANASNFWAGRVESWSGLVEFLFRTYKRHLFLGEYSWNLVYLTAMPYCVL